MKSKISYTSSNDVGVIQIQDVDEDKVRKRQKPIKPV